MLYYLPLDIIGVIFNYNDKIIDKRKFMRISKYFSNLVKPIFDNFMDTLGFEYDNIKHDKNYRYVFELCHNGDYNCIPKQLLVENDETLINIMLYFNSYDYLLLLVKKQVTDETAKYIIDYFDENIVNNIIYQNGLDRPNFYKHMKYAILNNKAKFIEWYFNYYSYGRSQCAIIAMSGNLGLLPNPLHDAHYGATYAMAAFFGNVNILEWFDNKKYVHDEKIIKIVELCNNIDTITYMNNKGYNLTYDISNDYYYNELKDLFCNNINIFLDIYDGNDNYKICKIFVEKNNLKMVKWLVSKSFKCYDTIECV